MRSDFAMINASCILQYGSHSKKRPNNLVIGRTYDHHVYDLVEVGIENFKAMESFVYDKKLAPKEGSKPFMVFIGEGFESITGLIHLKEVLLDLFRGEVCLCISFSFTFFCWQLEYVNRSDAHDSCRL
jgi:ribosome production factor 2